MAYVKKEWKNKELIPENELAKYPRFDADNMNRIEEGVAEATAMLPHLNDINNPHKVTAKQLGALRKTIHIMNPDVLSLEEEGWYYCYTASNVPTVMKNGYLEVRTAGDKYRTITWHPADSNANYTNTFIEDKWTDWNEFLTNKGGTIKTEQFPGVRFAAGSGDKISRIMKNAGKNFDYGLLLSDYNDNSESESVNLMLSYRSILDNSTMNYALRLMSVLDGKANYYNIFGEHNRESMGVTKIQSGAYSGGNTKTKTIPFTSIKPKVLIVMQDYIENNPTYYGILTCLLDSGIGVGYYTSESRLPVNVSVEESGINITSDSPYHAMNSSGYTYHWIILG